MKKTKRKHPCSPGVWKKLNSIQKVLWVDLYEVFLCRENYPAYLQGGGPKDRQAREVIAHNLACTAVWELNSLYSLTAKPMKLPKKFGVING